MQDHTCEFDVGPNDREFECNCSAKREPRQNQKHSANSRRHIFLGSLLPPSPSCSRVNLRWMEQQNKTDGRDCRFSSSPHSKIRRRWRQGLPGTECALPEVPGDFDDFSGSFEAALQELAAGLRGEQGPQRNASTHDDNQLRAIASSRSWILHPLVHVSSFYPTPLPLANPPLQAVMINSPIVASKCCLHSLRTTNRHPARRQDYCASDCALGSQRHIGHCKRDACCHSVQGAHCGCFEPPHLLEVEKFPA